MSLLLLGGATRRAGDEEQKLIGLIPAPLRIGPWHLVVEHRPYTFHDSSFVGLSDRLEGIIARWLGTV